MVAAGLDEGVGLGDDLGLAPGVGLVGNAFDVVAEPGDVLALGQFHLGHGEIRVDQFIGQRRALAHRNVIPVPPPADVQQFPEGIAVPFGDVLHLQEHRLFGDGAAVRLPLGRQVVDRVAQDRQELGLVGGLRPGCIDHPPGQVEVVRPLAGSPDAVQVCAVQRVEDLPGLDGLGHLPARHPGQRHQGDHQCQNNIPCAPHDRPPIQWPRRSRRETPMRGVANAYCTTGAVPVKKLCEPAGTVRLGPPGTGTFYIRPQKEPVPWRGARRWAPAPHTGETGV